MTTPPLHTIHSTTNQPVTHTYLDHNGWQYGIYVGPLAAPFKGGNPHTHRLVAVIGPRVGVYIFATTGYLSDEYVAEHMPDLRYLSQSALEAVVDGIAGLLGRPTARSRAA